jgi:uncharacterized protein (TIGR00369 family)
MNPSLELLQSEFDQLSKQFPSAVLPPNCSVLMKGEYVHYESRMLLTISFPVLEQFLNPMKTMQGGFITAAFDNVIGPLSYLAARNPCTSMDIHTNYIRPIVAGDVLTITAKVVSRGNTAMHLSAEAVNNKGRLVATCSANMVVMK